MKVILIKIYGEAEEMVHVSVVSGTPLGLRDMTVISQITDRWGTAGPSDVNAGFTQKSCCSPNAQKALLAEPHQKYAGLSMQFTPPSHFTV